MFVSLNTALSPSPFSATHHHLLRNTVIFTTYGVVYSILFPPPLWFFHILLCKKVKFMYHWYLLVRHPYFFPLVSSPLLSFTISEQVTMLIGVEHLLGKLDRFKNLFLELPLNFLALVISRRFSVQVQKRTEIELRGLEKLDLADMDLLL